MILINQKKKIQSTTSRNKERVCNILFTVRDGSRNLCRIICTKEHDDKYY